MRLKRPLPVPSSPDDSSPPHRQKTKAYPDSPMDSNYSNTRVVLDTDRYADCNEAIKREVSHDTNPVHAFASTVETAVVYGFTLEDFGSVSHTVILSKRLDLKEKVEDAIARMDFIDLLKAITSAPVQTIKPADFDLQTRATLESWEQVYEGDAAIELWRYISKNVDYPSANIYASYTAVVQSSGAGKSRAVDEMAKRHLVIPLCLRGKGMLGYPPADAEARDFFCDDSGFTSEDLLNRSSAFLQATFIVLAQHIHGLQDGISFQVLAESFRFNMTDDLNFEEPNGFRKEFYRGIVKKATDLWLEIKVPRSPDRENNGSRLKNSAKVVLKNSLTSAFDQLMETLARKCRLDAQRLQSEIIVLAMDESHGLCVEHNGTSCFLEFRRALRHLCGRRFFALFLSTTGKVTQFVSSSKQDGSSRVSDLSLTQIKPYTNFQFDLFARPRDNIDHDDVSVVSQEGYMSQFGRPLFATRYNTLEHQRGQMINFAVSKLLKTETFDPEDKKELSMDQQFACLAQRLPLEYISSHYLSKIRSEAEFKQVESHMRVCIDFSEDMLTMQTVTASEPILSEAAFVIMQRDGFNASTAFKNILNVFPVNKGDRGEFVALLLVTLARDAVVAEQNGSEMWTEMKGTWNRVISVEQFLRKLLLKGTDSPIFDELCETFEDTDLHFNHFIKVNSAKLLHVMRLSLLRRRGAAVLCMDCQFGVDFVIPCFGPLVQLVLFQIKNDANYRNFRQSLFDYMTPVLLKTGKVHSMIRIIFALAAPRAHVEIRKNIVKNDDGSDCIAYDIWIAGVSPEVLGPIKQNEEGLYEELCEPNTNWSTVLEGGDIRKSMYSAWSDEEAGRGFWTSWCSEKQMKALDDLQPDY